MLYETLKLLGSGCVGAIVGAFAQHCFAKRRDRKAGVSKWQKDFVGFVTGFKTAYARCDLPGEQLSCFNSRIPELSRLAAQVPQSISATKRDNLAAIVAGLGRLTDRDAACEREQVIQMLEKLEVLTRDS